MQGVVRTLALLVALPALAASAGMDPALEEDLEVVDGVVDGISEQGVEVFMGMLEAFLHRKHATAVEIHCMSLSITNATHTAFRAATDVAAALSPFLNPEGTLSEAAAATADLLLLLPELEASFERLFDLFGGFLGPCVGSASRDALQEASRHMANLTYVSGHLQANGADIVRELADAGEAFEAGRLGHFGRSVGKACRKVLLSKASTPQLPEGAPSLSAVANLTAGVLRGFFGKGFEIDIDTDARRQPVRTTDAMNFRSFVVTDEEERSRVHLHIDLHRCVGSNLQSLQPALLEMLEYFARQELATEEDAEEALPDILTATVEDGPAVLSRCGLGRQEVETLGAAMEALASLRVQLRLPRSSAGRAAMRGPVEELQRAADDWKALDWFRLGEDLGRMLLQLTVQAFPQKYALVPSGALGKRLAGPAAGAEPTFFGTASLLLLGLAGARSWRLLAARCGRPSPSDLEQGAGGAAE